MAANYWESTQRRHWQFTKFQLAERRQKLEDEDQNLVQMYPLPELRHLSIFFNQREYSPFSFLLILNPAGDLSYLLTYFPHHIPSYFLHFCFTSATWLSCLSTMIYAGFATYGVWWGQY